MADQGTGWTGRIPQEIINSQSWNPARNRGRCWQPGADRGITFCNRYDQWPSFRHVSIGNKAKPQLRAGYWGLQSRQSIGLLRVRKPQKIFDWRLGAFGILLQSMYVCSTWLFAKC